MNEYLQQQIEKYLESGTPEDESYQRFLAAVAEVYDIYNVSDDNIELHRNAPSLEVLVKLLEMTSDAGTVLRRTPDGSFEREWYSDSYPKLLGYSPDELEPLEAYKRIVHKDDMTSLRRLFATLFCNQPDSANIRCIAKSGEVRWLKLFVFPELNQTGTIERILIAFRDVTDEKRIVQERETSYAVLRAVLESTIDGVEVTELTGSLITYNKKFMEMWRLPSTWAKTDSHQGRLRPIAQQTKDAEKFLTRVHSIMAQQTGTQYDVIELRDGRILERYASCYHVGEGNTGVVWSYRDLTESLRTESTLSTRLKYEETISKCSNILFAGQSSDEALADALQIVLEVTDTDRVNLFEMLNVAPVGVSISLTHQVCASGIDPLSDSKIIEVNNDLSRWIEIMQKGDPVFGNTAGFPEPIRHVLEARGIQSVLVLPIFFNGGWSGILSFDSVNNLKRWNEDEIRLLRTISDMVGVAIESKKKTPAVASVSISSIQQSRDTVYDALSLTIFGVNEAGTIVSVEGMPSPFGNPLLGQNISAAFAGSDEALDRARQQSESVITVAGGSDKYQVRLTRLPDPRNGIILAGAVRKMTEKECHEGFRKEIIGIVSHELRTPLAAILGSLKLLSGGATGELSDQTTALLDIARNNGERLLLLLNDIIDVEKIEAGTLEFVFEKTDLYDVLEESVSLNSAYAQMLGASLALHPPPDETVFVNIDRGRIIQVLTNLISNAVKFSPEDGSVELRLVVRGDSARVEIIDHGPGIPEDFQPRIFEKFAHREPNRDRVRVGAGLGLSITKAIVERHNGTIGFDTADGTGTTFFFELAVTV